jgi:hypothetical protein
VTGVVVPENAVARTEKGAFLYAVQDGIIHIQPVRILGVGQGKAAVHGDIVPGTPVAVAQENKLLSLSEGIRVTAVGSKK